MARIPEPRPDLSADRESDIDQMIADCQSRRASMDEWEREFIGSIFHRVADGFTLTFRQTAKLQRIWDRVTDESPAARR